MCCGIEHLIKFSSTNRNEMKDKNLDLKEVLFKCDVFVFTTMLGSDRNNAFRIGLCTK